MYATSVFEEDQLYLPAYSGLLAVAFKVKDSPRDNVILFLSSVTLELSVILTNQSSTLRSNVFDVLDS